MKVEQAVDVFLTALRADGVKPETVTWYRHRLSRFVAMFGGRDLRKLTIDDVRAYLVQMRGLEFAPYTYFTLVRAVRRLFKWLKDEDHIGGKLHTQIKLPKLPQPLPKAIEMSEVVALLDQCNGTLAGVRDRAVILFLFDTGCRVGGLCGLRMGELDLEHRSARLLEKGERARTVLFGAPTRKALGEWLKKRPFPKSEFVFTSMREERPVSGNTVIQMLRRHAKCAGVTGRVNPHAFRHAFAREYILNGGDLASVSDMLGHSQIAVTKQFYAVFQAEELREKHEAFSPVSHLPKGRGRRKKHNT
jgi:site-specific recombinase XerD